MLHTVLFGLLTQLTVGQRHRLEPVIVSYQYSMTQNFHILVIYPMEIN